MSPFGKLCNKLSDSYFEPKSSSRAFVQLHGGGVIFAFESKVETTGCLETGLDNEFDLRPSWSRGESTRRGMYIDSERNEVIARN